MADYNLTSGVASLYLCEDILAHTNKYDPKEIRVREKIEPIYDGLIRNLAHAYNDYTFIACMGEARYAHSKVATRLSIDNEFSGRSDVYRIARDSNPTASYPAIVKVFSDEGWYGSYGGRAWLKIAVAGQKMNTLLERRASRENVMAHLDYMVDLSHNNGSYINKSDVDTFFCSSGDYRHVLNAKRDGDIEMISLLTFAPYEIVKWWIPVARKYISDLDRFDASIRNTRTFFGEYAPPSRAGAGSLDQLLSYERVEFGSRVITSYNVKDNVRFMTWEDAKSLRVTIELSEVSIA